MTLKSKRRRHQRPARFCGRVATRPRQTLSIFNWATGIPPPTARRQQRRIPPAAPRAHPPNPCYRIKNVYRINCIPIGITLQPCSDEDQFFQAAYKVNLPPLVGVIAEATAAASQGRRQDSTGGGRYARW